MFDFISDIVNGMGGVVTYLLFQANTPIIEILSSSQRVPVVINAFFLMPPQCGKTELRSGRLGSLVQYDDECQLLVHTEIHRKEYTALQKKK